MAEAAGKRSCIALAKTQFDGGVRAHQARADLSAGARCLSELTPRDLDLIPLAAANGIGLAFLRAADGEQFDGACQNETLHAGLPWSDE